MKKTIDHDIRYSDLSDEEFLLKWMSDEEINKWFVVKTESEIKPFVSNWIGFSKFKASLTATISGVPCGIGTLFLMPYKKIAHQCFFQVVVDRKHQNKGIGKSLIKNLINLSKNYFKHELIYADIFSKCLIEKILIDLGFEKFAQQEGYVFENNVYKDRICYGLIF